MQASNAIINVIPKGRPEHISLDFDRLRAEGIRHLENLATEIWTDFNAHDPGITLLELLCYAITDLGYRTRMLPIQDIAAGQSGEKPWFDAHEILPVSPVTAYDLRKILIDMEGVKNAWLERAKPQDFLIKDFKGGGKYLKKNPPFKVTLPDGEDLKIVAKHFAKQFGAVAGHGFAAAVAQFRRSVEQFNQQSFPNQLKLIAKFQENFGSKITDYILCHFGHFHQEKFNPNDPKDPNDPNDPNDNNDPNDPNDNNDPKDALPLNGIYRVLLELDDHLDPASEKVCKRYTTRARRRLHQDRGICQDYLQPEVVQNWPYCICLDLEVDPDRNEKEVAAEVLYRIQEFLVPTVRSYNFKQMQQRGLPCDQIFNGPLLTNGFIPDDELKASARLPRYIYRSDLQRIASETPGVLDVRDLRLKVPDGTAYSDTWQIPVVPGDSPLLNTPSPYPSDPSDPNYPPGNLKPLLDPCCSKVTIHRNGLVNRLTGHTLEDQYKTLRMARQSLANEDPGGPEVQNGVFRNDLDDFVSIQYDLPDIYSVGNNQPRPGHIFPAKQLQAYLLFYDQILAGYLAQLGQVRRLFAVDQNPADPTMVLQPLFEVPGAKELMGDFADMVFPSDALLSVELAVNSDKSVLEKQLQNLKIALLEAKDEAMIKSLEIGIKDAQLQLGQLEQIPELLQPFVGKTFKNGLSQLRAELENVLGAKYFAAYGLVAEDTVWQYFTAQKNNNLVQLLDKIADPLAHRQQRRNRLLDHLIARFGESFSEYVATLSRPDADPEDNPWRQDFSEYLRDKASFLQTIHTTGTARGSGFDYRLHDQYEKPDVWNSNNVSGLQKRVCRLLGIGSFRSRSLLGTLPYRVEVVSRPNRQGAPVHYVQLESREEAGAKRLNPLRPGPIMRSNSFKSKALAEKFQLLVYQNIWQKDFLKGRNIEGDIAHSEVYFDYSFKVPIGDKEVIYELKCEPIPEEALDTFLSDLRDLVKPQSAQDQEGFHLVEHILLRPDDERDELLQLPLGCYLDETPRDPYSFWLTVVLPKEAGRFEYEDFQQFVEQSFRRESPAHLALRFCWVTREQLLHFEPLFEAWLEAKARCSPEECHVTDAANNLIKWLNETTCSCACEQQLEQKSPCA